MHNCICNVAVTGKREDWGILDRRACGAVLAVSMDGTGLAANGGYAANLLPARLYLFLLTGHCVGDDWRDSLWVVDKSCGVS